MGTRKFPTVPLVALMTPPGKAICVELGKQDPSIVRTLREHDFDHAPVTDGLELVGLVPRVRLESLLAEGHRLELVDPAIVRGRLAAHSALDETLDLIATDRCAIVTGGDGEPAIGFITLSDLNKHPLRGLLYPLFAELEAELAAAVDRHFNEPWEWLGFLDKDKQARLVGYWELSKREGVDIGPLAGTMLSELSRIVEKCDPVRETLGFASRKCWGDFVGGLIELRNTVMHPVRPLFATQDDVADTRQRLDRLLDMLVRLESAALAM